MRFRAVCIVGFALVGAGAVSGCLPWLDPGPDGAATAPTYASPVVPLQYLAIEHVPAPVRGEAYARQFSAVGGEPPYRWSIAGGALPSGFTLDPSGLVTGTTHDSGDYAYDIEVEDALGARSGASHSGTLNTSGKTPFQIATMSLPVFGQDHDVGFEPFLQGGTPPYRWTVDGLPTGLTVDAATGTIAGRTSSSGVFDLTMTLTDATGATASGAPANVSLSVEAPQPVGGTGGGTGLSCAPYDAPVSAGFQYAGMFAYDWQDDSTKPPSSGTGVIRVSFDVACVATGAGTTVLKIVDATGSDAFFGAVGKVGTVDGSVMAMPASPPTTPSSPSQPGQGIVIMFPNGAVIATTNDGTGASRCSDRASPSR